jgi:hypothetical protein
MDGEIIHVVHEGVAEFTHNYFLRLPINPYCCFRAIAEISNLHPGA